MSIEVECVNVRDDRLRLRGVNTGERAQGLFTVALSSTPTLIKRSKDAIETQSPCTEPYSQTHLDSLKTHTLPIVLLEVAHAILRGYISSVQFVCQTLQV